MLTGLAFCFQWPLYILFLLSLAVIHEKYYVCFRHDSVANDAVQLEVIRFINRYEILVVVEN